VPDDEGGPGSPFAEDIANELANPNTSLGTMNFNFDYIKFKGDLPGASSQWAKRITFQPSLPYKLSETSNLFVRPAIPLILKLDVPDSNGNFDSKGADLGSAIPELAPSLTARTLEQFSFLLPEIGPDGQAPTPVGKTKGFVPVNTPVST